jgi:hypothetical protein
MEAVVFIGEFLSLPVIRQERRSKGCTTGPAPAFSYPANQDHAVFDGNFAQSGKFSRHFADLNVS